MMKRKTNGYLWIVLLLVSILPTMLIGCGTKESTPPFTEVSSKETMTMLDNHTEEAVFSNDSEAEEDPMETDPEGYTVTVSSIEELLEAIGPKVGIVMEPGYYNMSEYIENVWENEGESWNERHPYVQLRDCFDGVEVVIRGVDGLSICGDNENRTEIVIDPRYAQVFNFEECHQLFLSGLTMGHTESGECSGNVLNFSGCQNITLSAMDLYGCGVYGIGSYDGTGEMYVYSTTIRDCTYGALEIFDGVGRFEFHNCMLTGSEGYDYYEKSSDSELAFYECVFGNNETSYYMFLEDIYTEDCIWSENYTYPEYGFDDWAVFEPDTMESVAVDKAFLEGISRSGYAMVNPESGETIILPYEEPDGTYVQISLELNVDGTGWFENTNEYSNIIWDCDEDSLICITLEDGRNYYMTAYTMADKSHIWLLLELEECLVWL
ncbi:MAG: hypothetical protein IKM28_00310 [Lachnospiraceae bacterium]|nr:hypothetical protein [Lachnospiraceae bacterium]